MRITTRTQPNRSARSLSIYPTTYKLAQTISCLLRLPSSYQHDSQTSLENVGTCLFRGSFPSLSFDSPVLGWWVGTSRNTTGKKTLLCVLPSFCFIVCLYWAVGCGLWVMYDYFRKALCWFLDQVYLCAPIPVFSAFLYSSVSLFFSSWSVATKIVLDGFDFLV